jgi:hypothetical protein
MRAQTVLDICVKPFDPVHYNFVGRIAVEGFVLHDEQPRAHVRREARVRAVEATGRKVILLIAVASNTAASSCVDANEL